MNGWVKLTTEVEGNGLFIKYSDFQYLIEQEGGAAIKFEGQNDLIKVKEDPNRIIKLLRLAEKEENDVWNREQDERRAKYRAENPDE
jgi:hypothetical protein